MTDDAPLTLEAALWRWVPEPPAKAAWYSAVRAPIGDDPVRWRERHVEGLAPYRALRRVPMWLGITIVASLKAVGCERTAVFEAMQRCPAIEGTDLGPRAQDPMWTRSGGTGPSARS